jgi:uncharacterized C2H2 Zn-finger protein
MKSPLCQCNNCDAILIDKNSQTDAIEHNLNGSELDMVFITEDAGDGKDFWACPNCLTDGYLSDIITKNHSHEHKSNQAKAIS